ncbi:ippk-1, partial [Pristionchus pacificus]
LLVVFILHLSLDWYQLSLVFLHPKPRSSSMVRPRKNGRLPSPPIMVVDVSLYRSFCFRGEGRANIVISAKHRHTNNRIVWRFAKTRKSGELSLKTKSMVVGEFMETMVSPLLHSNYLVKPRTVEMRVEDVHQLAKIPKLEANSKVEDISELESVCSSISLLPLPSIPQGVTSITCLEMLDATCIPKRFIALSDHSTITMEIKPKQGYYQNHPGIDLPYCNNCILQMEKCVGKGSTFTSMYDFCPLALFSTQVREQREALESLIRDPHRNLRIFLDGKTVHSNETFLQRDELQSILYPEDDCCLDDLLEGVLSVLNGSKEGGSGDGRDSLLQQLLKGQKMDELGIVKAHQLFFTLSQKEQAEVGRKVQSQGGLSFLQDQSPVSLLKRFFLAATLKDCSIMISLRLIKNDSDLQEETDLIRLPSNKTFAYSVKVVDLDPKAPKNMISSHRRLMGGAEILKGNPSIRRPCIRQPL